MDDIAEVANAESAQAESYYKEVQATGGETMSQNTAEVIDQEIADVIDDILKEVPDVIQNTASPQELHYIAQRALSAISSQSTPSTGATTSISNSEGEMSPPLSNNSINFIVEDGVYKLLPTAVQ